jgi:predicted transcriptional regulator
MAETIPLTFRIDADLKRQLDAQAAADFRSTASLLNSIIARHLAGASLKPDPHYESTVIRMVPDPTPEPEVTYTKPRGRPRLSTAAAAPYMPAFRQWLERHGNPEMVRPGDVVTEMTFHKDATESAKSAAVRNWLAAADYEPLVAHYPDGSEEEIWRISPENM